MKKKPYLIRYTRCHGKTVFMTHKDWLNESGTHLPHRVDGAAMIWGNGEKDYWLDEFPYDEDDYWYLINKYKALPKILRMAHNKRWVREL